ncbi:MAG: hypothetical protein WDM88_06015 [Galbitalea sp.]
MSEFVDHEDFAVSPFAGLVPTRLRLEAQYQNGPRNLTPTHVEPRRAEHVRHDARASRRHPCGVDSQFRHDRDPHQRKPEHRQRTPLAATPAVVDDSVDDSTAQAPTADPAGDIETAAVAPEHLHRSPRRHVSGIAGRYGLSTASVLALTGSAGNRSSSPARCSSSARRRTSPPRVRRARRSRCPGGTLRDRQLHDPARRHRDVDRQEVRREHPGHPDGEQSGRLEHHLHGPHPGDPRGHIHASTPAAPTGTQVAQVGSAVVPLTPTMAANAQTIISVGRSLGVPSYASSSPSPPPRRSPDCKTSPTATGFRRPLPAAAEHGLGHRRPARRHQLREPAVLRRTEQPEQGKDPAGCSTSPAGNR